MILTLHLLGCSEVLEANLVNSLFKFLQHVPSKERLVPADVSLGSVFKVSG